MTQRKSFGSDNHAGVHPAVLQAIADANPGDAVAYGADERTEHLSGRGDDHRSQPGVVAVTQSTELGTCYTLAELQKIADFGRASDLRVYLDGARLANAAAGLDCSLAELAECADVLSFGGTKN